MSTSTLYLTGLTAIATLLCSCSTENLSPNSLGGDRAQTQKLDLSRSDCKVVLGRATGSDTGLRILFLTLKNPSEATAVDRMYDNARQRGAAPEGAARQFANTSIETSENWYILFSRPTLRVTGDLVEYVEH